MNKRDATKRKKVAGRSRPRRRQKVVLYVRLPRGTFAPPRMGVTLRFNKTSFFVAAAATSFSNIRFEPTFAYDVDPTIGSTAMPYFTEWGGIYRFYRVTAFKATLKVYNKDPTPKTIYLCPMNFDPGANTVNYQPILSNPLTVTDEVGSLTGNGKSRTLVIFSTISQLGGAANPLVPDSYSAQTSGTGGAPANNAWVTFGSYGDANDVNGCSYTFAIDIDIDFFETTTPAT